MAMHFPFDPDIANASTIPSRLYNDPVYLELEQNQIFAKTWQLVGRTEQVAESGSYFTAEIANENIVIVRDGESLQYHRRREDEKTRRRGLSPPRRPPP